jgi:xanthine dehydrogenase accessory factor
MIFKELQDLIDANKNFVMVTISEVKGSAPQDLGAKCLITKDGLYAGTVGGGKVEAHVIKVAIDLLKDDSLKILHKTWNLQKDIGMTCGGEVSFLFEKTIHNNWPIIIFGAGHVSQALSRTLMNLDCQLTVVDPRREWIDKLPTSINTLCTENCEELIKNAHPKTFFISMTKGHSSDVPKLKLISDYHPDTPYVGVIGSDVKGKKIKSELKELGVSDNFLKKLKVPIGLKIGTNQPYEIAISVIAELLQVRDSFTQN